MFEVFVTNVVIVARLLVLLIAMVEVILSIMIMVIDDNKIA